jgi:hypothetical protein
MPIRPLSALDLVRVWEWGEDRGPADRGLGLLSLALPDRSEADLPRLTVGQRDACLLLQRCATLGDVFEIQTRCPRCAEDLEFTMQRSQLLVAEPDAVHPGPHTETFDGHTITFRLPDSHDLAAVAAEPDPATARAALLRRCVLAVVPPPGSQSDALPPAVATALAEAIGERDPQANIRFQLHCAACHERWDSVFDIVRYFWEEITAQVKLVTREVHGLAAAYGWSEHDILAMSAVRRRWYLSLLSE